MPPQCIGCCYLKIPKKSSALIRCIKKRISLKFEGDFALKLRMIKKGSILGGYWKKQWQYLPQKCAEYKEGDCHE